MAAEGIRTPPGLIYVETPWHERLFCFREEKWTPGDIREEVQKQTGIPAERFLLSCGGSQRGGSGGSEGARAGPEQDAATLEVDSVVLDLRPGVTSTQEDPKWLSRLACSLEVPQLCSRHHEPDDDGEVCEPPTAASPDGACATKGGRRRQQARTFAGPFYCSLSCRQPSMWAQLDLEAQWPEGARRRCQDKFDEAVVFDIFRPDEAYGFLSPWHRWSKPVDFWIPAFAWRPGYPRKFLCHYSEQAIMATRACLFKDRSSFEHILGEQDPARCRKLGMRTEGGKHELMWNKHLYETTHAAVETNPDIQAKWPPELSGHREIVAAAREDTTWGVGLDVEDVRVRDPVCWRGRNILGCALSEYIDLCIEERRFSSNASLSPTTPQGTTRGCNDDSIADEVESFFLEEQDPCTVRAGGRVRKARARGGGLLRRGQIVDDEPSPKLQELLERMDISDAEWDKQGVLMSQVPDVVCELLEQNLLVPEEGKAAEAAGVVWMFKACTGAMGPPRSGQRAFHQVLLWLIDQITFRQQQLRVWAESCPDKLPSLLHGSPALQKYISDNKIRRKRADGAAVELQYVRQCSLPEVLAVVVTDARQRWESLESWQQDFLVDEVLWRGPCGNSGILHGRSRASESVKNPPEQKRDGTPYRFIGSAIDALCLLDRTTFPFMVAERCIRAREFDTALRLIESTPAAALRKVFLSPWRAAAGDTQAERSCYLELYNVFKQFDAVLEAREVIDRLVDAKAESPQATQVFLSNTDSLAIAADFFIAYVSTIRQRSPKSSMDHVPRQLLSAALKQARTAGASHPVVMDAVEVAIILSNPDNLLKVLSNDLMADCNTAVLNLFSVWGQERLMRILMPFLQNGFSTDDAQVAQIISSKKQWTNTDARCCPRKHPLTRGHSKSSGHCNVCDRHIDKGEHVEECHECKPRWVMCHLCDLQANDYLHQHGVENKRRAEDVLRLLWMYVRVLVSMQDGWACLHEVVVKLVGGVFHLKTPEERQLDRFCAFMEGCKPLRHALAAEAISSGTLRASPAAHSVEDLLVYPGFFRKPFQELIRAKATMATLQSTFKKSLHPFLLAVVKLHSIEMCAVTYNLSKDVQDLCMNVTAGGKLCTQLFLKVINAIVELPITKFYPKPTFGFAHLVQCAVRLREVVDCLKGGASTQMQQNISHVVDTMLKADAGPSTWLPLLNTLDTILFFLQYADLEDLELAYKAFHGQNDERSGTMPDVMDLLTCVRSLYCEPLLSVSPESLAQLSEPGALAKLILAQEQKLIHTVMWQNIPFEPADFKIIMEIAAHTSQMMYDRYKIAMVPHHTQMITLLMFSVLACGAKNEAASWPKSMLARLGTGEGKSLVIAMLAAFVAKKDMRAHVVINNETLIKRDFETMSSLFAAVGVKAQKVTDGAHDVLEDTSVQVVYCSARKIEASCLGAIKAGRAQSYKDSLQDAILIVDEVDGLIIDDRPNRSYVFDDDEMSSKVNAWIDRPGSSPPRNEEESKVFQNVQKAQAEMESKVEGTHYVLANGTAYFIDPTTKTVKTHSYSLWLEILRKELAKQKGGNYHVRFMTDQAIICSQRCFTSYLRIFGLTGSMGRKPEKQHLEEEYGAAHFNVPAFLDTCKGVLGKPEAKLIAEDQMCQPSEEAQFECVKRLVKEKCAYVPVLVIVEDPGIVKKFTEELRQVLPEGDDKGPGVLMLLPHLENGGSRGPQESHQPNLSFGSLVDLATKPVLGPSRDGKASRIRWRVAVTTAEGARGHDYKISDGSVDENGGLLLVITWVPWSDREWTQFKGRTARQDHPGQYAVILNTEDERMRGLKNSKGSAVIEELLRRGDEKIEQQLQEAGMEIKRGSAMHDLTIEFWAKKHLMQKFPNALRAWVGLCKSFRDMSVEDIRRQFYRDVYPAGEVQGAPGAKGTGAGDDRPPTKAPGSKSDSPGRSNSNERPASIVAPGLRGDAARGSQLGDRCPESKAPLGPVLTAAKRPEKAEKER